MTTVTQPLILAVDDETSNLQLLRQILQDHYRLRFAKDGPRALELAREERPDLILLDVMMPGMSGYEVCAALKADPALAAIPVIFVTALNDTDDELEGFAAGAVDYITKPVSPPIVRARVRTHLSLVRMEELRASRLEIVQRLGLAAEYKDNETGLHVIRMSHFARILGLAAGMTEAEADDLLHGVRGFQLLESRRGHPPVDLDALRDLLLRVAFLGEQIPELRELDLNPVIARPSGYELVDVRARVGPVERP